MKLRGGFLIHTTDCIRSTIHEHTRAVEQPVSETDLKALNAVQATPWRINGWLLDVMQEAWAKELRIGGLEVGVPVPLPGRFDDAVWGGMAPEAQKAHLAERSRLHAANARIEGRSAAVLDALSVATSLRDRPAIWYPHGKDFRQRIYPLACTGPHPQGSDISKALIMFASGLPLGPDGLFWLCVRAANCWGAGIDKLTLEERVAWTLDNSTKLRTSATSPLSSVWWTQADEPWSFLATCHELEMALTASDAEHFTSHLPIPLDGSCNGIQHLAAMGLDPIAARAVNMTPDPERQDIYQEVADRASAMVAADAAAETGSALASMWSGRITRKTVKRAVMTTPYGVTDRGIQDQLLADNMVPEGEHRREAAAYLKDKIVAALGDTAASAKTIMGWLQTTAERLARAGLPLTWTTPSGSTVRQAYHVTNRTEVRTLAGRAILFEENLGGGLDIRKQAAGSAPNVIHSFDAAHLSLTVCAAHDDGIRSFAMIHDSFGTHAANTTALSEILRQRFVAIYKTDHLARIRAEIAEYAPHVVIDAPPARGSFDIAQVQDAPYFFS